MIRNFNHILVNLLEMKELKRKYMSEKELECESKKDKEKSKEEFKSAKFMFSVLQQRYENEINRKENIESKTDVFIAFSGVLLLFFSRNIKIYQIVDQLRLNCFSFLEGLLLLTFTATFIALIIAVVFFVRALKVQLNANLSVGGFNEKNARNKGEEEIAFLLIKRYKEAVVHNKSQNDIKVDFYKKGRLFILAAFLLMALTYIISIFI